MSTQWYCLITGKQYGPVEEEVLKTWIAEARLGSKDYVWQEGQPDWKLVGDVFGSQMAAAPPPLPMGLTPVAPPGGTGGQTPDAELTRQVRELFSGRWGLPIALCLLIQLISMGIGQIPVIGGIANLILTGPLELGSVIFFLTFVRRGPGDLGMMFAGFKNFGNALAAYLLMALFTFLWLLLLIIPGIIAALSYSMTFYLIADDSRLGAMDAIRKSKEMMDGHKARLFVFGLRFIPWVLLCILTVGIGFLWLMPYMSACYARFYDDLRPSSVQPAMAVATATNP